MENWTLVQAIYVSEKNTIIFACNKNIKQIFLFSMIFTPNERKYTLR